MTKRRPEGVGFYPPHMTARFWEYINGGFVKITIKPGQTLEWGHSHRHEEGWSSEYHTWENSEDDGYLYETIYTDGVDCDGRLSTENMYRVSLTDIDYASRQNEFLGVETTNEIEPHRPKWESTSSRQRDYSAEAMGY